MAESMDLAEPAPLCIENFKGQAQAGWTTTGLGWKHTLSITGRRRITRGLQFPLGPSGCMANMGDLTCLEIGLAIVPGGGLMCLSKFIKLL